MFALTYSTYVIYLAHEVIQAPKFISLSSDHVHVTNTEHIFYTSPGMDKDRALIRIIEIENPASAIIFCNTKQRVHYLSIVLQRFGYDADELTADLAQKHREKVLERVRRHASVSGGDGCRCTRPRHSRTFARHSIRT